MMRCQSERSTIAMKATLWAHETRDNYNPNGTREQHRYGSNAAAFHGDELSIRNYDHVLHINNLPTTLSRLYCRLADLSKRKSHILFSFWFSTAQVATQTSATLLTGRE